MTIPRALRALSLLGALIPIAAFAAEPQFKPLSPDSLARAKAQGKAPGHTAPAAVRGEMRATLGADGKVRLECVTVNRSAFPSRNAPAEPMPPTEAK